MAQAAQPNGARTQLPSSKTFWKLVNKPIAESLLFAWTGLNLPGDPKKGDIIEAMLEAQVTIDWARIARWLKTQASDPAVTPPEGVEPHHWAFDREFYIQCRADAIKVDPLRKSSTFGLRPHMEPKVVPEKIKRPPSNLPATQSGPALSIQDRPTQSNPPLARVATAAVTAASGSGSRDSAPRQTQAQTPAPSTSTAATPSPRPSTTSVGVPGPVKPPSHAHPHSLPREPQHPAAQTAPNVQDPPPAPTAPVATGAATAATGSALKESAPREAPAKSAAASTATTQPPPPPASAPCSGVPSTAAKRNSSNADAACDLRDPQLAPATQPAPAMQNSPPEAIHSTTGMSTRAAQTTSHNAGQESTPCDANASAPAGPVPPPNANTARGQHGKSPVRTASSGALTLPREREPVASPLSETQSAFNDRTHPSGANPARADRTTSSTNAPARATALTLHDAHDKSQPAPHSDSSVPVAQRQPPETQAEVMQVKNASAPTQPPSGSEPIAGQTPGHWSDVHQHSASQEVVLWDASNVGEYTTMVSFILKHYKFPGGDNEPPSLPPRDADRMKATMPVAVRGRDPRPSESTEETTDFTVFAFVGVTSVWFWPEDRVFYIWSRNVLDILIKDPRFDNACFLVKGLDGTGSEFSLGLIDRRHADATHSWRLPLRVCKRTSLLTRFHQVHLVIDVILEQREIRARAPSEEQDVPKQTPEPDTSEKEAVAPDPKGKRRSGSSAPGNKSKGKQRAGSSSNRSTAKGPRERKPPREPANDRDAYFVEYLETLKDSQGLLLTDSKLYRDIREVTHGATMAGDQFFEAVELIDQLTNLRITNKSAQNEYLGKVVTQQAVAVFFDVGKNWLGIVKDIKRLLDLYGDMEEVQDYQASISTFGIGAYAVQKGLNDAVERGQERQASHASDTRPKKRVRTTASTQAENHAGPSNSQQDHDGPGYDEFSD